MRKQRKETLSKTPSKAIRQALRDLESLEGDPSYRIDMGKWHQPMGSGEGVVCSVCLAGAAIANAVRDPSVYCTPSSIGYFGEELGSRLLGLDDFRSGDVNEGLRRFDKHLPKGMRPTRDIERYEVNPEKFKKGMMKLADDLEKRGL